MDTHKRKPIKRKFVKNNVTVKNAEIQTTKKYATRYSGRNASKVKKYTDTIEPNTTKSNASKGSKHQDEDLMSSDEDDPSSCDDYDDKSWKDSDESSSSSIESSINSGSSQGSSRKEIKELQPSTIESPAHSTYRRPEFPSEKAIVSHMIKNVLTGQASYNSIKNCSYTILSYNKNLEELNGNQFEDMVTEKVAEIFIERSHLCRQFQEARRIKNIQQIWKKKFLALKRRTTLLHKRLAKINIPPYTKEVSVRNVATQLDLPFIDDAMNKLLKKEIMKKKRKASSSTKF